MINQIIPGHFRAFTFWTCLVLGFITYLITHNLISLLGIELLILGLFLGNQTTHLAQEDHSAPPPTKIEGLMQKHRVIFIVISSVITILGLYLLI